MAPNTLRPTATDFQNFHLYSSLPRFSHSCCCLSVNESAVSIAFVPSWLWFFFYMPMTRYSIHTLTITYLNDPHYTLYFQVTFSALDLFLSHQFGAILKDIFLSFYLSSPFINQIFQSQSQCSYPLFQPSHYHFQIQAFASSRYSTTSYYFNSNIFIAISTPAIDTIFANSFFFTLSQRYFNALPSTSIVTHFSPIWSCLHLHRATIKSSTLRKRSSISNSYEEPSSLASTPSRHTTVDFCFLNSFQHYLGTVLFTSSSSRSLLPQNPCSHPLSQSTCYRFGIRLLLLLPCSVCLCNITM